LDDPRDDSPDPPRGQMVVDRDTRQNFSERDELRRSRSPPTTYEQMDRGYWDSRRSRMSVDEESQPEPSNPRGIVLGGFDDSTRLDFP
jgi:hypothetical protein